MQSSITISGAVGFSTQYRATRAVFARSRASLLSYGFFVGVPVLTVAAMLATRYDVNSPSLLGLPTWAALLLGPAFVFLFLPFSHALNVWQMRRKNKSAHGALTFIVTPEGFESHGGAFDVKLRWDGIWRVVETRDFFLFYVAASWAHFIPKTFVASSAELQAIRALIHEAVGERAQLRTV